MYEIKLLSSKEAVSKETRSRLEYILAFISLSLSSSVRTLPSTAGKNGEIYAPSHIS